jgi:hypothetical protein
MINISESSSSEMIPKLVAMENGTNEISIADNIVTGTDDIFGEMDGLSILHFISTLFYHLLETYLKFSMIENETGGESDGMSIFIYYHLFKA